MYHLIALAHLPPMCKARCPIFSDHAKPFQDIVSSPDVFDAGGDPEREALLASRRPAPIPDPKKLRKRLAASGDGPGVLKKKQASFLVCKRLAAFDKDTAGAGCSAVVGCSAGVEGSAAGVRGPAAAAAFSHEASRQQYQRRQGKGKGSTAKFKYSSSDPHSKAEALALAQKWCDDRNQ